LSINGGGSEHARFSGDISKTGVFVVSSDVCPPGSSVHMEFVLAKCRASAEGAVKWAKRVPPACLRYAKGGIGIEFTEKTPELEAFLSELIPS